MDTNREAMILMEGLSAVSDQLSGTTKRRASNDGRTPLIPLQARKTSSDG
jgi:hypothetical protein